MKSRSSGWRAVVLLAVLAVVLAAAIILNEKSEEETVLRINEAGSPREDPYDSYIYKPYSGTLRINQDLEAPNRKPDGPTGLDRLDREVFSSFRIAKVKEYEQLGFFHPDYHPFKYGHRSIFGSISFSNNWVGPAAYYVANPYHLIILTSAEHISPLALYCQNVEIVYSFRRIDEEYTGAEAAHFFRILYKSGYVRHPGMVRVMMVNAHDAGFRYAYLDLNQSENLEPGDHRQNIAKQLYSDHSFFHVGRYGKNNLSPSDPRGWVRITRRDRFTKFHIKLWRKKPPSTESLADLVYEIRIIPD